MRRRHTRMTFSYSSRQSATRTFTYLNTTCGLSIGDCYTPKIDEPERITRDKCDTRLPNIVRTISSSSRFIRIICPILITTSEGNSRNAKASTYLDRLAHCIASLSSALAPSALRGGKLSVFLPDPLFRRQPEFFLPYTTFLLSWRLFHASLFGRYNALHSE
jgi:hypothetical protein